MIIAVSCDPPVIPDDVEVTDNSFKCSLSVQFSKELLCHIVTIELQEGNPRNEYSLTCSLDDEIVFSLYNEGRDLHKRIESGFHGEPYVPIEDRIVVTG